MGRSALPVTESEFESGGELESPWLRVTSRAAHQKKRRAVLTRNWKESLAREETLRAENHALLERQCARSREFEHRLFNGLQLVASALLRERRTATVPAAAQLTIAAGRITAFSAVHRRLHLREEEDVVEITQHLQGLCDDLTGLLFTKQAGQSIVVHGENCRIPSSVAVPIGLIVNELITNSVKHAGTHITVRFETTPAVSHSITVMDDGPGLPGGFDPANSRGMGMQIVLALVKEIGGELRFQGGENGRGTCVTITFCCDSPGSVLSH